MKTLGDQAWRQTHAKAGLHLENSFSGATSFLRQRYSRSLAGADVVVSGVPYDLSTSNRPGCRFGPRAIRQASVEPSCLEAFPWGFDLYAQLSIIDWGDLEIDFGLPHTLPQAIRAHILEVTAEGGFPLTLGGDHYISGQLIRGMVERLGHPLALLQLDAHSDTWAREGTRQDHGTMFWEAVRDGVIDTAHSIQVGLRTFNDQDHGIEILTAPWVHRHGIDATLTAIRERVGDRPVYLSVDIDVLDPAFAPGTGTPVPGGLASWQVLEIIRGLVPVNLVAMDLVEVSPPYDHAEITALAAATIAHDVLGVLAEQRGAQRLSVGRL